MPEGRDEYTRFALNLDATSPAVRRMRYVLAPIYGFDRSERLVAVYAGCLFTLQHRLDDMEAAERDSDQARNNLMGFCTAAAALGDEPPKFGTSELIVDFLAPYVRHAASEMTTSMGCALVGAITPYRGITDAARATLLRVLGEQAVAPFVGPGERILLCQIIFRTLATAHPHPGTDLSSQVARWMLRGGLLMPAVRLLARPLPEGLPSSEQCFYEISLSNFLYLLLMTVSAAVGGVAPTDVAAAVLSEVEAAVLAHSPWIWTRLCQLGSGRRLELSDRTLGFGVTAFAVFAGLSPATYRAACAAGGEAALKQAAQSFAAGWPNPGELNDIVLVAVEMFKVAGSEPPALQFYARNALYPTMSAGFEKQMERCASGANEAMERAHRTRPVFPPAANKAVAAAPAAPEPTGNVCAGCGERKEKTKLCSGCKKARYCSSECQRNDWRRHKTECRAAAAQRQ